MNPGDFKYLNMNFSIDIPEEIIGTLAIVPSLKIEGLQMLHNTNTNCGQKIRFKLFNKNHNKKVVIGRRDKLAIFATINKGLENFRIKYEHFY